MMFEIIIALFIGIFFGVCSGLFPGIHINLVAAFLLASIGYFSGIEGIVLVVFIVAMAITHTFIDFIPSVFLGAPDDENFLAVLPGHELLRKGRGHEAVVLTLYGGLIALPIILIFSVVFILFLPIVFGFVKSIIAYILIFSSLYLVFREKEFILGIVVFLMAGFLGLFAFNLPVREPLLPLLSGLFGLSGLIISVKTKTKIPRQKISKLKEIRMNVKDFLKTSFAVAVAAPLCSFLPGIGSGHAAIIGSEISGSREKRKFLFLVGAVNTVVMGLSFVTVYAIGKGRTGSAAVVQEILGEISFRDLLLILGVVVVVGLIAFVLGVGLSKFFARYVMRFNYSKISLIVAGILVIVNLILSNWIGIVVLITGAAVGIFCVTSNVRRIQMMGCLLLPSIVYYLTT
ncbi:tripartite tricarboxylate transporter permease [Candidatus Pacearchaeota archaeon]|nr:tripartite tricarboxylate transporter permease [Candidatus Pacearchaeota archaeon]